MTSPFDAFAENYAELWSASAQGTEQRLQVWHEIDRLFSSGDSVLDIRCDAPSVLYQCGGMRMPSVPHPHYDPCPSDIKH